MWNVRKILTLWMPRWQFYLSANGGNDHLKGGGSGVWTRQFPTSFKASLVCRCTIKLKSLYQTRHSNFKNGRTLAMISAIERRSTMWGSVMRIVRKEKKETLPRNAKRMAAFLNVVWGMKTSTRELCGTKWYQHQKLHYKKALRFFYSLSPLPASVVNTNGLV